MEIYRPQVKEIFTEEQNEFYNPSLANNGGGYSQPYISIVFTNYYAITIVDTSCGDYGDRWYAFMEDTRHTMKSPDGNISFDRLATWSFDSMNNNIEADYEGHFKPSIIDEYLEAAGYNCYKPYVTDEEVEVRDLLYTYYYNQEWDRW